MAEEKKEKRENAEGKNKPGNQSPATPGKKESAAEHSGKSGK